MYIDFIDLKKACLKDCSPWPCIDALIDLTVRYSMMSFLDALSR